jgi:type VI secretion system protein ImpL
MARIESMCFDKLSSEDGHDVRTRAFQHLVEARDLLTKLSELLKTVTMGNAFERSPWVRALIIGSGVPGTGHRIRHNASDFAQMGLHPPAHSGTPQPGGMPLHALLDDVLLPERDIVPTHVRWRDDVLLIILWIFGFAAWAGTIAVMIMR